MKLAIIHDWLTGMRGGEKVLEVVCELFPEADIFTLLHIKGSVSPIIEKHKIITSFIQNLPFVEKKYRSYLPLFPTAIERFDLAEYDLIISSSHCVAKGIIPSANALHISYLHTPMRYVWDMYHHYFGKGKGGWLSRLTIPFAANYLRTWDISSNNRVDYFIANSKFVQKRIWRYYRRNSDVIYPPVDVGRFQRSTQSGDYFLVVSAFAPYKRIDIAIKAFNQTKEKLVIVGQGSDEKHLKSLAKRNIEFVPFQSIDHLVGYYRNCKALIFPGEEDFGIVPLEAQACGKPVIAYGRGGSLETVIEKKTGLFFLQAEENSLLHALDDFTKYSWNPEEIRNHACEFDRPIFKQKMQNYIQEKIKSWENQS